MLHQRKARTINGVTFKFRSDVGMDRLTVTVLMSENRTQRRAWQLAMKEQGASPATSVAECWEATLERLGLKATMCDTCGMTASYSVTGPVICLDELLSFPLLRVEYRDVAVPRGGRPQDYVIVSDKGQERVSTYIPCPHGPKPPVKKERTNDELPGPVSKGPRIGRSIIAPDAT